eukprot:TRINITY_DN26226_c0_g1_i3.p4 TRINITY_DN26226_c0_g1~~TRINITY_DN26226_c0_g1_i3.p4  ORF type:complete len:113 (-),score=8.88 TRINITY_DN26226_c0_g1_i3:8-346(-)
MLIVFILVCIFGSCVSDFSQSVVDKEFFGAAALHTFKLMKRFKSTTFATKSVFLVSEVDKIFSMARFANFQSAEILRRVSQALCACVTNIWPMESFYGHILLQASKAEERLT